MQRRKLSTRNKLAFSLLLCVFFFGLLEGLVRIIGAGVSLPSQFGQFEEQVHFLLRRGIFVEDEYLFWKLQPGIQRETPIAPGGLRVNRLGLRGPDWPIQGAPQVLRVATLGDSCTFGWSVREEEAYPLRVQNRLKQSGYPVEVINGGVPGYTSFQAVRLLERDLLPLAPRYVTFYFGWNELWPARGRQDAFQTMGGWNVELENILAHSRLYTVFKKALVALRTDYGSSRTESTLPRVSPEQYRDNLKNLLTLAKQHGIQLILLTQPAQPTPHAGCWSPHQHELLQGMNEITRAFARENGIALVDAAELLRNQPAKSTYIDCIHPSSAGHEIVAQALSERLQELLPEPEKMAP